MTMNSVLLWNIIYLLSHILYNFFLQVVSTFTNRCLPFDLQLWEMVTAASPIPQHDAKRLCLLLESTHQNVFKKLGSFVSITFLTCVCIQFVTSLYIRSAVVWDPLRITVADSVSHGSMLGSGYEPWLLCVKLPIIKSAVTDSPSVLACCSHIIRCSKRVQLLSFPPLLTAGYYQQFFSNRTIHTLDALMVSSTYGGGGGWGRKLCLYLNTAVHINGHARVIRHPSKRKYSWRE